MRNFVRRYVQKRAKNDDWCKNLQKYGHFASCYQGYKFGKMKEDILLKGG